MALPTILVADENGDYVEKQKPLELDVDYTKLTVGELRLMRGYIADDAAELLVLTAEFVIHHTNWTEDEVNRITAQEMMRVFEMLREVQRNGAIPLASSDNSANGQTAAAASPNGATTLPLVSDSESSLNASAM